jgi:signal transduction histidine kinase
MYSQEETRVIVKSVDKDDYVEIQVWDEGVGITESSMPLLFGKYFRETNEATTKQEGNGLGLFIARSYITLMKGIIYCESVQGKGSMFSLSLSKAGADNHG